MNIWYIFSSFCKNNSIKVQVIYTFIYEHKIFQEIVSSLIILLGSEISSKHRSVSQGLWIQHY